MIFSQYKENFEILLDYPEIGGGDIKYYVRKAIRNVLHVDIDIHSRRLISEISLDGTKCIYKLHSHCANMNFSEKSGYGRLSQQVTHKGGVPAMNYIKIFQNSQALSVSVGNSYSGDKLMHIFLDNFHQGGRYTAQITSHQAEMVRKERFTD